MRCLCLCLCWVLDGDYVSQIPYVWYYVVVKSSFNMIVRNASPRRHMCFRYMMFSLSVPCELLFLLRYCLLDLSCGGSNVISLYFLCCSVNGSVCLVCCVFVNCLVKQFAICLGMVVILLLNIMEVLSVGGGVLLDRPSMVFQNNVCVVSVTPVCI